MSSVFFLFVILAAFTFAKVEIAVEGKEGWAGNLPTWKLPEDNWASLLFFSGKPATGYHVWMETFVLAVLHTAYIYVVPSWTIELQIIAFFLFFSILEDFLWFALNPYFGLKNFRAEKIWWHAKHWWWIAPRDYYILGLLGVVLYAASFHV